MLLAYQDDTDRLSSAFTTADDGCCPVTTDLKPSYRGCDHSVPHLIAPQGQRVVHDGHREEHWPVLEPLTVLGNSRLAGWGELPWQCSAPSTVLPARSIAPPEVVLSRSWMAPWTVVAAMTAAPVVPETCREPRIVLAPMKTAAAPLAVTGPANEVAV